MRSKNTKLPFRVMAHPKTRAPPMENVFRPFSFCSTANWSKCVPTVLKFVPETKLGKNTDLSKMWSFHREVKEAKSLLPDALTLFTASTWDDGGTRIVTEGIDSTNGNILDEARVVTQGTFIVIFRSWKLEKGGTRTLLTMWIIPLLHLISVMKTRAVKRGASLTPNVTRRSPVFLHLSILTTWGRPLRFTNWGSVNVVLNTTHPVSVAPRLTISELVQAFSKVE